MLAVLGAAICDDPERPEPRQVSPDVVPTGETPAPEADESAGSQSVDLRPEATIPRFIHSEEAIGVASAASGPQGGSPMALATHWSPPGCRRNLS